MLGDTSRSTKQHRQGAVGHWVSLCVKSLKVDDSVKDGDYLVSNQLAYTISL